MEREYYIKKVYNEDENGKKVGPFYAIFYKDDAGNEIWAMPDHLPTKQEILAVAEKQGIKIAKS